VIFEPFLPLVVALSGAPMVTQSAQSSLDRAVRLLQDFEDEKAAEVLRALLTRSPPAMVAAKAHVYLGIIALDATTAEGAKAEFEKAVRTDVLVDLPLGQSPKVQILFAEARRAVAAGPVASTSMAAPPVGPLPAAQVTATAESPSHLPAYVVGGIGVAALAVGGIFGFLQQQAASNARSDGILAAALNDGQPYAQDGIAADVLFGVGGVALVTAIILFVTEGSSQTPAVAATAGPKGFALSGAF
jgi:hypothetical protein